MKKHPEMVNRARELRKNMTPEERKLWYDFLRSHPARFRRQQIIGPYILDFFCPAAKLAIELDGSGHYEPEQIKHDRLRDAFLKENGIKVLRFPNSEVRNRFSVVCEVIHREVAPLSQPAADSSPTRGEPGICLPPGGGGGTAKP